MSRENENWNWLNIVRKNRCKHFLLAMICLDDVMMKRETFAFDELDAEAVRRVEDKVMLLSNNFTSLQLYCNAMQKRKISCSTVRKVDCNVKKNANIAHEFWSFPLCAQVESFFRM